MLQNKVGTPVIIVELFARHAFRKAYFQMMQIVIRRRIEVDHRTY